MELRPRRHRPFVIPPEGFRLPGRRGTLMPGAPTLAELIAPNHRLELSCEQIGCRRQASIPPVLAAWLLGPEMPVGAACLRFRCSVCGARGRDGLVTSRVDWTDVSAARERVWYARPENGAGGGD